LLRNDGGNRRHWLRVRVARREGNTRGVLAIVRVRTGALVQTQSLGSQSSYLSQNALEAHFGLGAATRADAVDVELPGGERVSLGEIPADRAVVAEPRRR